MTSLQDTCTTGSLTHNKIEALLVEDSMLAVVSVPSKFHFMGIHPCGDV